MSPYSCVVIAQRDQQGKLQAAEQAYREALAPVLPSWLVIRRCAYLFASDQIVKLETQQKAFQLSVVRKSITDD